MDLDFARTSNNVELRQERVTKQKIQDPFFIAYSEIFHREVKREIKKEPSQLYRINKASMSGVTKQAA